MQVRFRHHPTISWRPIRHVLRVTVALTDTEHYALTRLGSWQLPLWRYQDGTEQREITPAQCFASARLEFDTLLQANEAQSQILRALEKLEVTLRQSTRSTRIDTFTIPQEDPLGLGRNHGTHSRARAKARGYRR